jgi:hypothetical protein
MLKPRTLPPTVVPGITPSAGATAAAVTEEEKQRAKAVAKEAEQVILARAQRELAKLAEKKAVEERKRAEE